jgi:uncharacterized protein YbcI
MVNEGRNENAGEIRARIASGIVRLHSEYYGKGPTRAKTYYVDDMVMVVLEETFTRVEKTLVARGEGDAISDIRRRFQQHMRQEFTSVVEQATGRVVRTFLSETNIEDDVSVEIFLLGEGRTDMNKFESSETADEPPAA